MSLQVQYQSSIEIDDLADSWPQVFDDRNAREQWGWNPKVDLDGLVRRMFEFLDKQT
jgi:threonine 3-dehydrogenase